MRDWLIMMAVSWNRSSGQAGQSSRVWLQEFPLSATEADVYTWAWKKFQDETGCPTTGITVLSYRAVPNIPPGHRFTTD